MKQIIPFFPKAIAGVTNRTGGICMRIKVYFRPEREIEIIDINYNYYITSMIYNFLAESDKTFTDKLHEEGYKLGSRHFKLFTFSQLRIKKYIVEESKIKVMDDSILYIGSPKLDFLYYLSDTLLKVERVKIGGGFFIVDHVDLIKDTNFSREERFYCLSPITTSTMEVVGNVKKERNVDIRDGKFVENLKNNLIRKYYLLYNQLPEDMNIEIQFDEKYVSNIKGKLIWFKNVAIKAYSAPFTIKADPEIIKVAYECGVGDKNSAGFGMIEIDRKNRVGLENVCDSGI